jgi:hypothetical protein
MTKRIFVLVMVLLGGCTPAETSTTTPATPATLASDAAEAAEVSAFIRDCDSSVYGRLGQGWREDAVVIGPIAFIGLPSLATSPERRFEPRKGQERSEKVLALVRAGPPVTVRVAPAGQVALLYDPSRFNAHNVADGDRVVRFVPCEPGESPYEDFGASGRSTQFNGGFVVAGSRCAALDVAVGGEAAGRAWVSFGAGDLCPRAREA